ncbi:hypothetical protein [Nocardia sp. NPDC051750]|uniref:hypothetical protein n=1 Tax=Nocardia sp. NPDC051750 TaxID=3364325 RepID=UPI0037A7FF5B
MSRRTPDWNWMKLARSTVVATLAASSLAVGFGTAHADPAPAAPTAINYSVQMVEKTVVTTLQGGTFAIAEEEVQPISAEPGAAPEKEQFVQVKDKSGAVVISWPVNLGVEGGTEIPVKPVLKNDDTVLELTPEKTDIQTQQPMQAVNLTAKPIASPAENQMAMNEFATQFSIATAVGGFVGTAAGVVVGGLLGCILGLPLLAIGCIPAAIAGAGIGGILGTIALGGPALGIAAMDLVQTLQADPGQSKWANGGKPPGQP